MTWKSSLAPPAPGGRKPSSPVPGGPALASRAGSRSSDPPPRALPGRTAWEDAAWYLAWRLD